MEQNFNNRQLEANLDAVIRITGYVQKNGHGLKIVVAPTNDAVREATTLNWVLDIDDFSFFYDSEADATDDQATLCEAMRAAGLSVAKVHKQNP